ncbi:MAG: recombination regulator RecX [Chlorobiaceae bacterium]|nr:recombination regulator RecX [Chlorobiaceae bacterium]
MASASGKQPDAALALALKLLGIRSHSRLELERKLRGKGFDEAVTAQTIERLSGKGLLDDREFGLELIASRSKRKPAGKIRLVAELRKKGVPETVIGEVLGEVDGRELCMRAAEKKLAMLRGPDENARKKKLETFLRNRGFSWLEIREALERFFPGVTDREEPV